MTIQPSPNRYVAPSPQLYVPNVPTDGQVLAVVHLKGTLGSAAPTHGASTTVQLNVALCEAINLAIESIQELRENPPRDPLSDFLADRRAARRLSAVLENLPSSVADLSDVKTTLRSVLGDGLTRILSHHAAYAARIHDVKTNPDTDTRLPFERWWKDFVELVVPYGDENLTNDSLQIWHDESKSGPKCVSAIAATLVMVLVNRDKGNEVLLPTTGAIAALQQRAHDGAEDSAGQSSHPEPVRQVAAALLEFARNILSPAADSRQT
jgi:hypothetical protein